MQGDHQDQQRGDNIKDKKRIEQENGQWQHHHRHQHKNPHRHQSPCQGFLHIAEAKS